MDLVHSVSGLPDPSDRINPVVWHGLVGVAGLGECPESLPAHFRHEQYLWHEIYMKCMAFLTLRHTLGSW